MAAIATPDVPYARLVPAFLLAAFGMALFFAPAANVVLSAVCPEQEGQASGASNAIRELGGVFGVAVLASVFSAYGSYESPSVFVDGLTPALRLGAGAVGLGAFGALLLPGRRGLTPAEPADAARLRPAFERAV